MATMRNLEYVCNIDESFNHQVGIAMFGCCLRDVEGRFISTYTCWNQAMMMIHGGEAIPLLESVRWINQLRLQSILFS
jgi:hypothetical protein